MRGQRTGPGPTSSVLSDVAIGAWLSRWSSARPRRSCRLTSRAADRLVEAALNVNSCALNGLLLRATRFGPCRAFDHRSKARSARLGLCRLVGVYAFGPRVQEHTSRIAWSGPMASGRGSGFWTRCAFRRQSFSLTTQAASVRSVAMRREGFGTLRRSPVSPMSRRERVHCRDEQGGWVFGPVER